MLSVPYHRLLGMYVRLTDVANVLTIHLCSTIHPLSITVDDSLLKNCNMKGITKALQR